MITKTQLQESLLHECDVCLHIFTKLDATAWDFRMTARQRSTLELLQYLTFCGIGGMRSMAESNWKLFGEYATAARMMTVEEFPDRMRGQKAAIEAFFASVSEAELASREVKLPGGFVQPLGLAIINAPLKWLAAYKLQLFLHAKATSAPEIGTANAWRGIDWKP
jgi:hypothetical protein